MPSFYKGKIPIITRSLNEGFIRGLPLDVEFGTGAIPRDYDVDPVEMRDSPDKMELIPESEWDARFDEAEATESSLEHIFLRGGKPAFDLLDQNGDGHCWAYSTGHAEMLDRLKQNLPLVRLNPHGVATMLKRFDGGWSGLSMKFARDNGFPVQGNGPGEWPLHSNNPKYDTPECRAQMALHKADEVWYDLGRKEWDQTLSKKQIVTCSFNNQPVPADFNRAGHAMCGVRVVRVEKGVFALMVLNSWIGFGYFGLAVLLDWWPNNAVALMSSTPSAR